MARRGTKGINPKDSDGTLWQITYVAPETVVYDERKLARVLKDRFEDCFESVFSKAALAGLVQEGVVTMDRLDRCSEVVPRGAPYALITKVAT